MSMTDTAEIRDRLSAAVHRNRAFSREGVAERLFTRAFRGLVYPQIWEDPAVDMAALDIGADDELVCIASGSCNVMSYLTAGPKSVMAVDLSPAHVALGRLKFAAAAHLPGHAEFRRLFVDAADPRNVDAFYRHIAPNLDDETLAFWTARGPLGRRRIEMFARGFYRHGALGRFIGFGHGVARLFGVRIADFANCRAIEEQRAFFDRKIAPAFDSRLVRLLASSRASLIGLGIPPAQYEALAGAAAGGVVEVMKQRTRKLLCDFPLSQNWFARQAVLRGYGPDGALPPYLEAQNFETLRAHVGCASIRNESLTDLLDRLPDASKHGFVLLDAQDWMTDTQLNALWTALTRVAAPGARVIFRTAAEPTLLPGRVSDDLLAQWEYREEESRAGTEADRSAIYGGFHLYVKKG